MDSANRSIEKEKPSQDRFVKLFNENPRAQRSKDGRPVEDIEYELQKEQCTFAPITNHNKHKLIKQSSTSDSQPDDDG